MREGRWVLPDLLWEGCGNNFGNHRVEERLDALLELFFNGVDRGEFRERPAPMPPGAIDAWQPERLDGVALVFGILAAVALDLDDQVQQVVFTMSIIDAHNEVPAIHAVLSPASVGNFEAQRVVLYVAPYAGMLFGHPAELTLPARGYA